MSAHTPGHWAFDADGYIRSYDDASRVQGNPMNVGTVCYGFKPIAQMEADARLIAAAPELAEALNLLVNGVFCVEGSPLWESNMEVARAALAKAGV